MPKDKVTLHVEDDTLTIEGEVALPDARGHAGEPRRGAAAAVPPRVPLSKELDADKVTAELNHGVLKLRIPKAEHAQPKKVEIRVG